MFADLSSGAVIGGVCGEAEGIGVCDLAKGCVLPRLFFEEFFLG